MADQIAFQGIIVQRGSQAHETKGPFIKAQNDRAVAQSQILASSASAKEHLHMNKSVEQVHLQYQDGSVEVLSNGTLQKRPVSYKQTLHSKPDDRRPQTMQRERSYQRKVVRSQAQSITNLGNADAEMYGKSPERFRANYRSGLANPSTQQSQATLIGRTTADKTSNTDARSVQLNKQHDIVQADLQEFVDEQAKDAIRQMQRNSHSATSLSAMRRRAKPGPRSNRIDVNRSRGRQNIAHSFSSMRINQLYDQDSERVPNYYVRPGPANYNTGVGIGTKNQVSKFKNSPSCFISKAPSLLKNQINVRVRASLEQQRKKSMKRQNSAERSFNRNSVHRSSGTLDLVTVEDPNTIKPGESQHRFYEFTEQQRQRKMKVLFPSYAQVHANSKKAKIGSQERVDPFAVKPEHATRCQHLRDSTTLNKSLGNMNREVREAASPISKQKEPRPGPADYSTIQVKTPQDRPLTAAKSFVAVETFPKAIRAEKVLMYSREYEKDYSNNLGPGPAAYQKIDNVDVIDLIKSQIRQRQSAQNFHKTSKSKERSLDRSYTSLRLPGQPRLSSFSVTKLRGCGFTKANRKLTQAEPGPGPSAYTTADKTRMLLMRQQAPRTGFTKASRTIDVVKFNSKNQALIKRGI